MRRFFSIVAFIFVFTLACARPVSQKGLEALQSGSLPTVELADMALNATVHIRGARGSGSGVAWDKDTIVTAHHVLAITGALSITTRSGETCRAVAGWGDPRADVAFVKVKGCKLHPLKRRPHGALPLGSDVLAAGHPVGLKWTIATGVVTSYQRAEGFSVMQTDAAINPGMSGGPVLDSHGHLVGISLAIVTRDGLYSGIGFAATADTIKQLAALTGNS